ncbi:MAG: hypothetical protein AAGA20_16545 [Planctomycetota bacterium]
MLRLVSLALAVCIGPGVVAPRASTLHEQSDEATSTRSPQREARRALENAPKREKLGRIRGVRTISRVVFAQAPDRPHVLTFSAAFPGRSRLILESESGTVERFDLGGVWFGREQSSGTPLEASRSYLLEGAGRVETRLDLALRRAVFFWPDTRSWTGAGRTRTAEVDDIGVLLATLDPSTGRPTEVRAIDSTGRVSGAFRAIEWKVDGERAWPSSLEFVAGDSLIWTEVVEEIGVDWNFADTYFLPSDRIGALVGRPIETNVRIRILDPAWVRRTSIDATTSLDGAVERALELWEDARGELEELDLAPLPKLEVELDAKRRPVAVTIEVAASPASDAAFAESQDWTRRQREDAGVRLCDTTSEAGTASLDDLRSIVVASGTSEGPLRLRLTRRETAGRGSAADPMLVQAYLPNERADEPPR